MPPCVLVGLFDQTVLFSIKKQNPQLCSEEAMADTVPNPELCLHQQGSPLTRGRRDTTAT